MSSMKNFAALRDAALRELNIGTLPFELQQEILASVGQNIFKSVVLALLSRLPQELHGEFTRAMDSGDEKKIDDFLHLHVSDFDSFVETEVRKALEEYKTLSTV